MHKVGSPFPALSQASRSVLVDLLVHGPASRADLARRSGLSPASLTRITRSLVDARLVSESDTTSPQRTGRPSQPMDVNVDQAHLIGIKLSAGQLDSVTTDLRGRLLTERTVALTGSDPQTVVDTIATVIDDAARDDDTICAVGVSLAGPVSPRAEIIHTSPFLEWTDVPLVAMIRERTGLPAVVENDVRALTAAEHWFGAAAGCSDFVLVTIGVGVGCGIVVDDRLIDGANGGSGQVGHLPVTPWGALCERGHRGCVRSYLSSTAIVGAVSAATGRQVSYDEVLQMARDGSPVARTVVEEAGQALGTLIGTIATVTAPAKVIVSGEGVALAAMALDTTRERAREVQHWTLPDVPIEIAPFTFTEWARGAAVIALRNQLDVAVRPDA
ncbi:ROK family protein [Nakamurella sp. GG22]